MISLQQAKEYLYNIFNNEWVQWIHQGTKPAENSQEKSLNVALNVLSKHCAKCLNINGCCFVKSNCPTVPLHTNCHCITVDIPTPDVKAECSIEKFSKYTFIEQLKNDKKRLFESWGYDILDSEYLQQEFIKQAQIAYSTGNYVLEPLNNYGQRINIKIELINKKKWKNSLFLFWLNGIP